MRSGNPKIVYRNRNINLYKNGDTWYVALHTSSEEEFVDGANHLKKKWIFLSDVADEHL